MAELTGAQLVSLARLLAQDTDADAYNQGLSNSEWIDVVNDAYYDFYVEANKGKVEWLFPVATAAYDGSTSYQNKLLKSVTGIYEIQALFLTDSREGEGVLLERCEPAEILYLQQRKTASGTPTRAGWALEEGTRKFLVYPHPVAAAITGTNPTSKNVNTFASGTIQLVATDGIGTFVNARAGALVTGSGLTSTPYITEVDSSWEWIKVFPAATPGQAGPFAITFTNYHMIFGGYVKKYPTALAGSTEVADLSDIEGRWVGRIAAARGMALNGDSRDNIEQVASPIPDQYRKLVTSYVRTQKPRIKSEDDALA